MRITNRMMTENSLYNINNGKEYLDKLSTQMATEKKVNNPSDDPITAIRALRFRSSLSDITQYLERNVSDGISWADNTQTSVNAARDVMTDLKAEYNSGTNKTNTTDDRATYLEGMKALADQYYSIGNTTNEDRYIFTGYRTGDSLTFTEADISERTIKTKGGTPYIYEGITEKFTVKDIEEYTFLGNKLSDSDIAGLSTAVDETSITAVNAYRIRLSYDNLDAGQTVAITYNYNNGGTPATGTLNLTAITDDTAAAGTGGAFLNIKTGNVIINKANMTTLANATDFYLSYKKSSWEVGDVKPEHYFDCQDTALVTAGVATSPIIYSNHEQAIKYDVGSSQSVKINANASDVFDLGVGRDIDDLERLIDDVNTAQAKVDRLKEMKKDTITYNTDAQQQTIDYLMNAANKELDYSKQRLDKFFSNGITNADKYYDKANLAGTNCGNTIKRLNLIKNRLTENQTTVKTQASENENIRISDITVEINEANMIYTAALMVTGRISQQSLVNYI